MITGAGKNDTYYLVRREREPMQIGLRPARASRKGNFDKDGNIRILKVGKGVR